MTMWVGYASAGKEFAAQEEAEVLGLWAAVPRKVEMLRRGYQRRAEPVITPYLGNYVFLRMTAEEWHWLQGSKTVRTVMSVNPGNARLIMDFIDRVEADFAERMAQIEAGQRVDEYAPGDLLQLVTGPFAGMLARFQRVAEGAGIFPEIVAEADMFGQAVTLRVDPIDARRAIS